MKKPRFSFKKKGRFLAMMIVFNLKWNGIEDRGGPDESVMEVLDFTQISANGLPKPSTCP